MQLPFLEDFLNMWSYQGYMKIVFMLRVQLACIYLSSAECVWDVSIIYNHSGAKLEYLWDWALSGF